MSPTEQQLLQIVSNSLGRPATPETMWDELGADSISMAEVLTEVEAKFGVRLDERVYEFDSIAQLAKYLDRESAKLSKAS